MPALPPRFRHSRYQPTPRPGRYAIQGRQSLALSLIHIFFVEEVPWGDGKRTLTRAYMLFLARWARRLSRKETAEAFRTSWEKVFDAVEHVVTFGLEHRKLGAIDAIGVDEIQYAKGHKYLTLVYQIDLDVTRLLWIGKERTIESFQWPR